MRKVITSFFLVMSAVASFAAPTANEDFVISETAKAYTNAVTDAVASAKSYTDSSIISAGAVTESTVTNISRVVSSDALQMYRSLTNDDVYAFVAQGTGYVYTCEGRPSLAAAIASQWGQPIYHADSDYWMWQLSNTEEIDGCYYLDNSRPSSATADSIVFYFSVGSRINIAQLINVTARRVVTGQTVLTGEKFVKSSIKINGQMLTNDITVAGGVTSVNGMTGDVSVVSGVTSVNSKTGAVTIVAADVGAFGASAGASLQNQVTTIGAHLNAEDARFVVTNYNSATHRPEAYVEIKLPDQSWSRIWSEMTRWDYLFGEYLPTNFYTKSHVDSALSQKADRAWGFYDSTTGAYSPDDYTWISSKNMAIAGNLAYQRTITSEGAVWVLESNGIVAEAGGMTNGCFRISDDEGNSIFELVKGNKRTIGADASSCQVVAAFTPTKLQIGYSVVSDVHPTIYVCESLSTRIWKSENDADCIANVVWSGSSGAWVAQVQGKAAYASLFVKAEYEVGGETYIRNVAPVSMQYIMLNGVKYAVGTASVSGHTVLTLTVSQ